MKIKTLYKAIPFLILIGALLIAFTFFYPQNTQKNKRKIIYVSKVLDYNSDFWMQLLEGANTASETYDIDFESVAPSQESDYERQNELIDWAIKQHPDAIILTPSQYTDSLAMSQKIVDQGIPLILVDSMLEKDIAQGCISTDNEKAGARQGAYIKEHFDASASIAVIAHEEQTSTSIERVKGLKKELQSNGEEIKAIAYTTSDYTAAKEKTLEVLRQHPDITVLVATNEHTTVGAATAIQELHLQDKVFLIGFDSSNREIQLMEEGILKATVIQKAFKMGYYAIENTVKMLNGEPYLPHMDSGSILITQEDLYDVNMQKLLFPFQQ